jgi:uncharacterized membrane protein YphA (DoxX/SURF4 family)
VRQNLICPATGESLGTRTNTRDLWLPSASVKNEGDNHENRSDRRHRAHRIKARQGNLRGHGHDAVAASPASGVNTLTGEGLAEAIKGASVVVDVSNAPSWEDAAVMKFFETSTCDQLASDVAAGMGHHVALSVVGTDRILQSGYFRAKIAQENLIKASSIPYSIVHATQFFEFIKGIADSVLLIIGFKIRVTSVLSGFLLLLFAIGMVTGLGIKTPFDYSVFSAAGAAFLLAFWEPDRFTLDNLLRRSRS